MTNSQNYLQKRYEFYLNVFSHKTHYKSRNAKDAEFRPINDYFFNSLYREMKNENISITITDLKSIFHSDFVPFRNPFIHFLKSIEYEYDGVDYIEKIASSVSTTDNSYFQWIFKKWFVSMVACIIDENVANETALIFIGNQGLGKTRWLRSLLPAELSEYYYSGDIDPNNKDHMSLFSSKLLINLDELTSLKPAKVESFKSLLSLKEMTFRRPYGIYNEDFPRIASVVGTSNHRDILLDTTGNRRYLCVEALELKGLNADDLGKAYKQAYALYKEGFKYYFTDVDIARVNAVNMAYMKADEGVDILTKYFEPCEVGNTSARFMNATELLEHLKTTCGETPRLNALRLGRLLNDFGFTSKKSNGIKRYALLPKLSIEETKVEEAVQSKQRAHESLFGSTTIPFYKKNLQSK